MATFTMHLDGFEATRRALIRAPELVRSLASSVVATTTFDIAQRARSLVPVDTGTLKASIEANRSSAGGLTGRVGITAGTNVYYWRFIEFGTKFRPATPFFRPAAELEADIYVDRMRAIGPRVERDFTVGRAA